MRIKYFILTFLLGLIFSPVFSQEIQSNQKSLNKEFPALITDRPDQTESSTTVPKNALQIETGFVYENIKPGGDYEFTNWDIATTLLRYGVWDNFELRLGNYYQQSKIQSDYNAVDSTQSGIGPIVVGFKVFVIKEKGFRPELAVMADLTINKVGNLDYRPTYTYSSVKILASYTLSDFFSLGTNIGYGNNGESANGFFVYSVVLGMSISERLGGFVELYGTSNGGDDPLTRWDAGLTYLVRHNLQLDVSGGTGLSSGIKMYFINFGLTWRIPR